MHLPHKCLSLLLLAFLPLSAGAREVSGIQVSEQISLAGTTLQLTAAFRL